MIRRLTPALLVLAVAAGCTAASDDDGELFVPGRLAAPAVKSADAVPVVVDTDLAPDDLAAIAFLMRHPDVEVLAITVPRTGIVACPDGLLLLAGLFEAVEVEPVPVACGRTPRGADAVPFPPAWRFGALTDSGLPLATGPTVQPVRRTAAGAIARLADRVDGLQVVALGPLTELAAVLRDHPASYRRIAGITSMAGIVEADSQDEALGVGEWNAAADPHPFAEVLAGPVPVTVVPDDPVPLGPPAGMAAPAVGRLGVDTDTPSPKFWDLATAGFFTTPGAGTRVEDGSWTADVSDDRGRLARTGDGPVRVVLELDADLLDASYRSVFTVDPTGG